MTLKMPSLDVQNSVVVEEGTITSRYVTFALPVRVRYGTDLDVTVPSHTLPSLWGGGSAVLDTKHRRYNLFVDSAGAFWLCEHDMLPTLKGLPDPYYIMFRSTAKGWRRWQPRPLVSNFMQSLAAALGFLGDLATALTSGETAAIFDTNIGPNQDWIIGDDTVSPETYSTITGNQPRGRSFPAVGAAPSGWLDPGFDDTSWAVGAPVAGTDMVTGTILPDVTTDDQIGVSVVWVADFNDGISLFGDQGNGLGSFAVDSVSGEAPFLLVVGTGVWASQQTTNLIRRYAFDGSSGGADLTGNGLNEPMGMCQVGAEIWVVNFGNNTISRFALDGTTLGTPFANPSPLSSDQPQVLYVVGDEVWVPNIDSSSISRINVDTSTAGTPLTDNGLELPNSGLVVGDQFWAVNTFAHTISRFAFDGTSAGSPIGLPVDASSLCLVGDEVWAVSQDGNAIYRFAFDGTSAGAALTGNGLNGPDSLLVVGAAVWVPNGASGANTISRFALDGTALDVLNGNGLNRPAGLIAVPAAMLRYRRKFTPPAVPGQAIDHATLWCSPATIEALSALWINGNVLPFSGLDTGQTIAASLLNDAAENVLAMEVDADEVEFRIVLVYAPVPTATYVWVMTELNAIAYLYLADGTATGWSMSTAATPGFGPIRQIGDQVWFGNAVSPVPASGAEHTINRLNLDGTSAGPDLTGFGTITDIQLVGSQVWVADDVTNVISRWQLDGTPAGPDLAFSTIGGPVQILVVGTDNVWVIGFSDFSSTQRAVNIFNFSGTLLTSFDPSGGTDTTSQLYVGIVGSEVWGAQAGTVWRMQTDGTAIASFSDTTITTPLGIAALGGAGWIVNYHGQATDGSTNGSIAVYNEDGTPTAQNPLGPVTRPNNPYQIMAFDSTIWVSQSDNGITIYNADRSLNKVAYLGQPFSVRGLGADHTIRDMTLVTMPAVPVLTVVNTPPTGGPSGDGEVNTLGLVADQGSLTATVDADLWFTDWALIIVDETDTIVGSIVSGFTLSVGVWRPLGDGGVSHSYRAVLSTADNSFSGANLATMTNTVTITWP